MLKTDGGMSIATVVTQTRHGGTLYVHSLSCYLWVHLRRCSKLRKLRGLRNWGSTCWDTCNAVPSGTRRRVIAAWTPRYICVSTYVGGYILWMQAVFFSSQNCEKRQLASLCLPVRPLSAWNISAAIGRIFMKFDIWGSNICRENWSFIKSDKNTGTLHEDPCTFSITSRSVLPRMKKFFTQTF